jgi:hypothetical protein
MYFSNFKSLCDSQYILAMKGSEKTCSRENYILHNVDQTYLTLECIFHETSITISQEGKGSIELRSQCFFPYMTNKCLIFNFRGSFLIKSLSVFKKFLTKWISNKRSSHDPYDQKGTLELENK